MYAPTIMAKEVSPLSYFNEKPNYDYYTAEELYLAEETYSDEETEYDDYSDAGSY